MANIVKVAEEVGGPLMRIFETGEKSVVRIVKSAEEGTFTRTLVDTFNFVPVPRVRSGALGWWHSLSRMKKAGIISAGILAASTVPFLFRNSASNQMDQSAFLPDSGDQLAMGDNNSADYISLAISYLQRLRVMTASPGSSTIKKAMIIGLCTSLNSWAIAQPSEDCYSLYQTVNKITAALSQLGLVLEGTDQPELLVSTLDRLSESCSTEYDSEMLSFIIDNLDTLNIETV